jgi:hypothetical protein
MVVIMKLLTIFIVLSILGTSGSVFFVADSNFDFIDDNVPDVCERDVIPPTSTLAAFPRLAIFFIEFGESPPVNLSWRGIDDLEGSGIDHYDIQVKQKYFGPGVHPQVMPYWKDLLINTTRTSTIFHPIFNSVYYFRVRAVDNAGNIELWPATWDTFIICVPYDTRDQEKVEIKDDIIHIVEHRVEQIQDIRNVDIQDIINGIRENEPPVAEAGDDITAYINKFPGPQTYEEDVKRDIKNQAKYPTVDFNGSSSYDPDGEIGHYLWDFGDGSSGYGEYALHTYLMPGEYKVTLIVMDNNGLTDKDTLMCTIGVVC